MIFSRCICRKRSASGVIFLPYGWSRRALLMNLRARYSGRTVVGTNPCGLGYVYVVIEHQSSPDNHMAFRLMRYAIAAMQRHLDAGHKTLPLVVPMLFITARPVLIPFPELAGRICRPADGEDAVRLPVSAG